MSPSRAAARIVQRTLRYAWFELVDPRDGIAFDRAFSSAELGWRNLFLDLPPKPGKKGARFASNWPTLRIEWTASRDNPQEQGLLAFPSSTEADGERVGRWVLNPGLTDGKLVEEGAVQADLVVVSGHGTDGRVFGGGVSCALSEVFAVQARAASAGVRVKYLLLPACYLAAEVMAPYWAPLFTRNPPFHGILGYAGGYAGDATGAATMRRFGSVMKRDPRIPLLDAWREANAGKPWGAFQLADSRGDNMADWKTRGLPAPDISKGVMHHDDKSFPSGVPTKIAPRSHEILFAMTDGTEIRWPNNGDSNPNVGLFSGKSAWIVVRALTPGARFEAGRAFHIVLYHFRPQRDDMDLDNLLHLTGSPSPACSIVPVKNRNPYKGMLTDFFDSLLVTPRNTTTEIRIPFRVSPQAAEKYKEDESGLHTHGRFSMILILSDATDATTLATAPQFDAYVEGAWLRK